MTKLLRRHDKVSEIERYYRVRLTVHHSFQHHVVVGVRQQGSAEEVKQDRFRDRRYGITC